MKWQLYADFWSLLLYSIPTRLLLAYGNNTDHYVNNPILAPYLPTLSHDQSYFYEHSPASANTHVYNLHFYVE
jgi:hypothetical protein